MKKFHFVLFLSATILVTRCGSNDKSDVPAIKDLPTTLKERLDPEVVKSFEEAVKNNNEDPVGIQYYGHYAYMNRQLEVAAWLYAWANEKKKDPLNQSNLGLCLHELSLTDTAGAALLGSAIRLLEEARSSKPDHAGILNNLGYAYYQQYLNTKDESWLDKADKTLNKALDIEPANAVVLAHLADINKEKKDTVKALDNLNEAFSLDPYNAVFINSSQNFAPFSEAKESRDYCDSINFNCLQNCPPSIIGRIKVINCEIAQQDAIMACREGLPYATSFNCDDEIPVTGFMIPGLQSGLGIITPWGKFAILIQGGGKIDFKLEANTPVPGVRFSAEGSYNPKSGMSITNYGGNVSVNLYNKGLVAPVLNKLNIGPLGVKVTGTTKKTESGVSLETYDVPVFTIH